MHFFYITRTQTYQRIYPLWFHLMLVHTFISTESYHRTTFSRGIARKISRDDDGDHKEDIGGNKDLVVETVGLGKIEREQRNLSNLKVVGLADQQINTAGEAGIIAEHHLSTHDLDLSKNLLRSWDALSETKKQLPELIILRLNHCRLGLPSTSIDHAAFSSITTLGLSSTKTPWLTVMQLEPLLSCLEDLQLGKNEIQHLSKPDNNRFPHLKCTNLEENEISSWNCQIRMFAKPRYPLFEWQQDTMDSTD